MPIAGLLLVAQILCAVHAGRTGRPYYWISLILFMPMVGMIAYLLIEILPELAHSRAARAAGAGVIRKFNPERDYRAAWREVQIAGTIENRANLPEADFARIAGMVAGHRSMKHALDWLLGQVPPLELTESPMASPAIPLPRCRSILHSCSGAWCFILRS